MCHFYVDSIEYADIVKKLSSICVKCHVLLVIDPAINLHVIKHSAVAPKKKRFRNFSCRDVS